EVPSLALRVSVGCERRFHLEAACGADVGQVAEMILDADVVEHSAQSAESDAHSIGAARAAELAAAFEMRLKIDDDAGDAAFLELLLELRDCLREVAKDTLVAAVAQVGRDEVL